MVLELYDKRGGQSYRKIILDNETMRGIELCGSIGGDYHDRSMATVIRRGIFLIEIYLKKDGENCRMNLKVPKNFLNF
jgi:hypothetical protein